MVSTLIHSPDKTIAPVKKMSSHQESSDLSTILFGDVDFEPPSNPIPEHAVQPVRPGPTPDRLAVQFPESESASNRMPSWATNSMDWGPLGVFRYQNIERGLTYSN